MTSKLDLYRVFNEVARCKSFSKAATMLYMTQPAVSQSIMQLENELEVRLFTRTPKGVTLTGEGEILLEYVNSAMNLLEAGHKKMNEVKNLEVGELVIGVGDTVSKYFLLPYLENFHTQYPNIKLKIINRTTFELCMLLRSGKLDFAVCSLPIKDSNFEIKVCMKIQDTFVCGKKYEYLSKKPISLKELSELPLILLEHKANSRQYIENWIKARGVQLQPEIELGSHDLLLEFAKINLGIAGVVREFSKDYLATHVLYEVELEEPIEARAIGICSLKGVSFSPASTCFMELLEDQFE